MIAEMAPTSVEFQIHQVVLAFHNNVVTKAYKKKESLFGTLSATYNKGTHATKMSAVRDETGQAANNKMPDSAASPVADNFFNQQILADDVSEFSRQI